MQTSPDLQNSSIANKRKSFQDITGKKFANLLVLEYAYNKGTAPYWNCKCDCGNVEIINGGMIKDGRRDRCWECKQKDKRSILGEKFGYWNVIEKGSRGGTYWLCECTLCKGQYEIRSDRLLKGLTLSCKNCSKRQYIGEISKTIFKNIKFCATSRNLVLLVSQQFIWDLFLKQDRKCALTGVDIHFARTARDHSKGMTTASLDRIDSTKGYTEDNVQWVHKDINKLKRDFEENIFVAMCSLVTKTFKNKPVEPDPDWKFWRLA